MKRALAVVCLFAALSILHACKGKQGPSGPAGQSVIILATPTPGNTLRFLGQWGGFGLGDGQFQDPYGVCVDSLGNVYVADATYHRIQKFTFAGAFSLKWGRNGGDGTSGTGNGEFGGCRDVAADAAGNIYVADSSFHRIQKFTSSGTFLGKWGRNGGDGSSGTGDGELNLPTGIGVDGSGNVYVVERDNHRVSKFTSAGVFVAKWGRNGGDGTQGSGNGEFSTPIDVAVDASGNVYVTESGNNRIQKTTSSGVYVTKWGKNGGDGSIGAGDGEFYRPFGISVDGQGNIFVVDTFNHRIQKFTPAGLFLAKWGKNGGDGTFGNGPGEFWYPIGVASDGTGYLYVSDSERRIQKFGP